MSHDTWYVMSDVPAIFLLMSFIISLISTLQTYSYILLPLDGAVSSLYAKII